VGQLKELQDGFRAERRHTFTMGAELGNLSGGGQRRWTLSAPEKTPEIVASVLASAEDVALPSIRRFAHLDAILDALSDNGPSSWLHAPIHDYRCRSAVALAYTLEKPGDFIETLIERSAAFLGSRNDPALERFLAFARRIRGARKPAG
jgi:hypothetical protein